VLITQFIIFIEGTDMTPIELAIAPLAMCIIACFFQ